MKILRLLLLLPFLVLADGDDLYLLKGAKVFIADEGFVAKDILVDDGKIILVDDFIENIETGDVIDVQGKFITPGLLVFSSLGLLEIGALPETNDTGSDIYNAGFENMSILDIGKLVKKNIECQIKIKKSNDIRSYNLDSSKLLKTGFKPKYSILDAIVQIKQAYDSKKLKSKKKCYSVNWLKYIKVI